MTSLLHCSLLSINCSLSSLAAEIVLMEFYDWMKTSVQDDFLNLTLRRQYVWFCFLGHNPYMRFLISVYCESFCAQLRLSPGSPLPSVAIYMKKSLFIFIVLSKSAAEE